MASEKKPYTPPELSFEGTVADLLQPTMEYVRMPDGRVVRRPKKQKKAPPPPEGSGGDGKT